MHQKLPNYDFKMVSFRPELCLHLFDVEWQICENMNENLGSTYSKLESKAPSLGYKVSSTTGSKAIQKKPISKNQKRKRKMGVGGIKNSVLARQTRTATKFEARLSYTASYKPSWIM